VDEEGEEDVEGDADVDGDADIDGVRKVPGCRCPSITGTTGDALLPPWPEPWAIVAGVDTMDSEAAVTNWVKFGGPLVFVVVGRSCLVDH